MNVRKRRLESFINLELKDRIKSPYVDAEVIMLASDIITEFGLDGVLIKLNSLGDNESRLRYQSFRRIFQFS